MAIHLAGDHATCCAICNSLNGLRSPVINNGRLLNMYKIMFVYENGQGMHICLCVLGKPAGTLIDIMQPTLDGRPTGTQLQGRSQDFISTEAKG